MQISTHEEFLKNRDALESALAAMSRGKHMYIVIEEPNGGDLEGFGIDILCVREYEYHVHLYNQYNNSENSDCYVIDLDNLMEWIEQTLIEHDWLVESRASR